VRTKASHEEACVKVGTETSQRGKDDPATAPRARLKKSPDFRDQADGSVTYFVAYVSPVDGK